MLRVRVPSRERSQTSRTKTCWLRERDVPDAPAVGEPISVLGKGKNPIHSGIIVEVGWFKDLEPAGRGRKKDDLYLRVSWV